MGAAATVARRIGEKNPDGAARAAVQSIGLGIAVAVPIGIAGALFAPRLLALMGASPGVIANGSNFTRIMLGANVVILLLFLINAIFRGAGDASIAMRTLWIANIINLMLDPCFIFGLGPFPKLGVVGAAVSTTCGRGIGVLLQFWTLSRGRGRIVVRRDHLKLEPAAMWRLLRISGNGIFQVMIGTASWVGIVRILSTFGSAVVAGYTIGIRIIVFAILPSWGLSNAAATLVGQNLGARRAGRARQAAWRAALHSAIVTGTVGAFFFFVPHGLVRLFSDDAAVLSEGARFLRILSYCQFLMGVEIAMTGAFAGAGDTVPPTIISSIFSAARIPLAWLVSLPLGYGPAGIWWMITVTCILRGLFLAAWFRRDRWMHRTV
jgi:putative MATE family efflux protein